MTVGPQLVCACIFALLPAGAAAGDPEIDRFERLIQHEEDRRKRQLPLIIQLARVQDADVIRYYLDNQGGTANINVTTSDGTTAIWHATMNMKKEVVALLAEYGANLHVQKKKSGLTPLMLAAMNGDDGCLDTLLKAGVDIDQKATPAGATAMALALQGGQVSSAQKLLDAGSKIDLSAHAWKMVVRLALHKKDQDREAATLAFIKGSIDDQRNKDILETLEYASEVASSADKKGIMDNDPDFDEPWEDQLETAKLEAPSEKDEL